MTRLKVGLIGCGRIAQLVHLGVLARLPGVEVVALAEPDAGRRAEAGRRAPGAAPFADYRELLARPEVEAVVICLPHALHAAAAIAALEAGKHLYLEKPLATDLAEGRAVLAAWERAGTVGMIGFNYRFHPLHRAARRLLRAGALGPLVGARTVFTTASRELPAWHRSRGSGGGALLNLGSHHLDLIPFLFGQPVAEVSCALRSQRAEDDTAALQLRLADGTLVQSFFSMSAVEADRFEIYGQQGRLAFDRQRSLEVAVDGPTPLSSPLKRLRRGLRALPRRPHQWRRILAPAAEPSFAAALATFAAAVGGTSDPAAPDLLDGYRSLAAVIAAEEAARRGGAVNARLAG